MIFERFHWKQRNRYLRLRLENCVNTIMELDNRLGEGKIRPAIMEHFEKLKKSLGNVTDDSVDERDIARLEQATNQLFYEIKRNFGEDTRTVLYDGRPH
ncbi:MAG: hypothetical protein AB2L11_03335 [Syntrophobacteraceae bacterium]